MSRMGARTRPSPATDQSTGRPHPRGWTLSSPAARALQTGVLKTGRDTAMNIAYVGEKRARRKAVYPCLAAYTITGDYREERDAQPAPRRRGCTTCLRSDTLAADGEPDEGTAYTYFQRGHFRITPRSRRTTGSCAPRHQIGLEIIDDRVDGATCVPKKPPSRSRHGASFCGKRRPEFGKGQNP